jgi:hypothetical protein
MANVKNTRQESVRDDIKKSLEEADTRDVFERALDYVPAVAGAVAGGAILRGATGKYSRADDLQSRLKKMTPAERARFDYRAYDAAEPQRVVMARRFRNVNTAVGAASGAALGNMVGDIYEQNNKKRRK